MQRHRLPLSALLWGALLPLFASCGQRTLEPVSLQGQVQGTYYSIIYYDSLNRNLQSTIDSLFALVDATASLWDETSLLCRINRNETDTLTPLFADMLRKSLEMSAYTQGAFDCTVGCLVDAWGFGARRKASLDDTFIDSLLRYTGAEQLTILPENGVMRLGKKYPQTRLDFNAIAQGVTSDLVGQCLLQKGIRNYLVDVGGEVVARGTKPGGKPWSVGVERPAKNKYSEPVVELAVALKNQSLVTSGSYRKYYEKDGVRYSHTIDPSTGRPVQHGLLSVSVVDRAAWRADALATSFMVMGLDSSLRFIAAHPDDSGANCAVFIYDSAGNNAIYATPAFKKIIINLK
ncbi:MAG: FAD:protein FMN transferase [Bacteroidales bacterium]|nr:FAD:protein FMN transferase [Bacteroidales bacterium]